MCSGERSSSAKGAMSARQAAPVGMVDVEQQGAVGLDDERPRGGLAGGFDGHLEEVLLGFGEDPDPGDPAEGQDPTLPPGQELDDHFAPADVEDRTR